MFQKIICSLTVLLFLSFDEIYSQNEWTTRIFGASYTKLQFETGKVKNLSLSYGLLEYHEDFIPWRYNGPFVDVGLGLRDEGNLLTNKLGYEYYYLIFAARMSVNNYTDFHTNQMCIRPEVGLHLFSKVALSYGYNFSLNSEDPFQVKGSIIAINVGLLRERSYKMDYWFKRKQNS